MPHISVDKPNSAAAGAAPVRILVLEDREEDYYVVCRFLAQGLRPGCTLTRVGTVAEALECLAAITFDLCLIDLYLPDGHGLQVVRWLTEQRPEVAVLVMTHDDRIEVDELALTAGADYFFAKSEWSGPSLARAVRYALQHRRRLREAYSIPERAASLAQPLPICMDCKQIRDPQDHWHVLESYLHEHAGLEFTHGFCPRCFQFRLEEVLQLTRNAAEPGGPDAAG